MDNSIYEVTRDEYVGFLDQIKPEARRNEKIEEEQYIVLNTYSKNTDTLFCARKIPCDENDTDEIYYVYNMPQDDERQLPKVKRKIVLENKEEVQAFLDVLGKLQRGELNGIDIPNNS